MVSQPKVRSECPPPNEPCPHVTCRYHLWTDRKARDGVVVGFVQTRTWGNPKATCALNFADSGAHSLDWVGRVIGVSRQMAFNIEQAAFAKLRAQDPALLRELLACANQLSDADQGDDADYPPDPEINDTGAIEWEGADTTGELDWSDPQTTEASARTLRSRRLRATRLAAMVPPFVCPYCGTTWPGVTKQGALRKGCSYRKCQGRAWYDAGKTNRLGPPAGRGASRVPAGAGNG